MLGELGHDSETQREEQIANLGVRLLELVAGSVAVSAQRESSS